MITYIPLSMRSGHTASSTAAASHRAWTRTQRYEDKLIQVADLAIARKYAAEKRKRKRAVQ